MTDAPVTLETLHSQITQIAQDLGTMRADLGDLGGGLRADLGGLGSGLRAEMAALGTNLRADLRADLASLRADVMAGFDRIDAIAAQMREACRLERQRHAAWEAEWRAGRPA